MRRLKAPTRWGILPGRPNDRRNASMKMAKRMNGKNGFTLVEVIILIAIIAVLAAMCPSTFHVHDTQTRSRVARVKADQRSMATALESYNIDHGGYPAWNTEPSRNAFGEKALKHEVLAGLPTFAREPGLETLTTPVTYISAYFADPFAPLRGATFCYWPTYISTSELETPAWIIWSPGPDERYDLTMDNIAQVYGSHEEFPSDRLRELTYDPTNGTKSAGDVWRFKT